MGWSKDYSEDEIVGDYTKPLKKIWDNLMPTTYPHILKFTTKRATEVKQKKKMGPYSMTENFIDFDCYVIIDNKPLVDFGWDGGPISLEMAEKAYGDSYFHNMRGAMVELMRYAGIKFSQFDFGGDLKIDVEDLVVD
jgi:hypothetical protein